MVTQKVDSVLLKEHIEHLIDALVLEQRWTKKRVLAYLAEHTNFAEATVYRWRQGRLRPRDETIEILAQVAKQSGKLDRDWGKSFLQASRYPQIENLLSQIWGSENLLTIPNNLPKKEHSAFIGRKDELTRLLKMLDLNRPPFLVTVDGIGGVGKTALILEAAYYCLRASSGDAIANDTPTFEAIIFVTAKQHYLTPYGVRSKSLTQETLSDIFREISYALDRPEIRQTTPQEQPQKAFRALARQKTLLIIDNLETMPERQKIADFLYHDLPATVKVVITTREPTLSASIRLSKLSENEGLQLIQHEVSYKEDAHIILSEDDEIELYQRTGGVPAAIIYAVGQLAFGYSLETVMTKLKQPYGDVARFCFDNSVTPLRGQPAHQLFMAIAMFPKSPLREAVIRVAGLDSNPIVAEEGLVLLQQLSLITLQEGRYSLLPLTREYGLAELTIHPDFELAARERWLHWYLTFAEKYGGEDEWEWHVNYDQIDAEWENFLAVFEWCAAFDRFEELKIFWFDRELKEYANIYGAWEDRIYWLEWLADSAKRQGKWSIIVECWSSIAWLLALMGTPEKLSKATKLLEQVWENRQFADAVTLGSMANHFAVLSIRKNDFIKADRWLNWEAELVKLTLLPEPRLQRRQFSIMYYQAELHFRRSNYEEAEKLYKEALSFAHKINWHRAILYTYNWLADLAIVKEDFETAESFLRSCLPVVERNKDKRRTAFLKRTFAILEKKRGNLVMAYQWAHTALDGFDRLGMQPEAEDMRQFLKNLSIDS